MAGSLSFFFHITGTGLLFTGLVGGWILERRIQSEKEWNLRVFISKISRRFDLLAIVAAVILLLTGIVNIVNQYGVQTDIWNTSGWLIAKIILFAFLLVNASVFRTVLIRRRTKFMQNITNNANTENTETGFRVLSKSISTYFLVQFILLIIIICLSIAGGGKHQGII